MDYLKIRLLDAMLPPISPDNNAPGINPLIYVGIGVVVITAIVVFICIKHSKNSK